MLRALPATILGLTLLGPAYAQRPAAPAPMQERHDQLARDMEGLSDGDPLMRIAVMESILKRGDASAADLAMRAGFASEDPTLRNLAMRTWIARLKRLNLTVMLPAELQKQVDEALYDPKQASELFKTDTWLTGWARRGMVLALAFTGVELDKGSGKIWSLPSFGERDATEFTISGNQIYATFQVDFIGFSSPCHLRLAPTPALTIEGYVACDLRPPGPQLRVVAPMF